MFSKLFEERDKTITHLVKLGDCVARSLRENVSLFAIDSNNSQVSYLTESGKVISGKYSIDKDVMIKGIKVQDSSVFEDGEQLDSFVNEKIHSFVESIHYAEYSSADDSFSDVLSLWENRLKLSTVQAKLYEQSSKLAAVENIIETAEFQKVVEISPQLQEFLSENFDKITKVPEVRNAINLSNAVSTAFNFPKLTVEELEENKSYTLKDGITPSIYDMVCRQELVKRELIESKRNFDTIWADNASIQKLASLVFGSDEQIVNALSEALQEIPYLALASKKSLFNTFSNCLGHSNGIGVSDKDIQGYSARIFEYKKEVKQSFIQTINEKYGVNIQNLQSPASFKSLANTQVVIFEALSRLSPKGSVLKEVLSEMAQSLKTKSGVECIDVNDYLLEMFVSVGYDKILQEQEVGTMKKSDFKRVTKDITDLKDLVKTLNTKIVKDQEYSSDENLDDVALAAQAAKEKAEPAPTTPPVAEQPDIDPAAADMAAGAEPEAATPEEQESLGNPPELPADAAEEEEDGEDSPRALGSQEDYASDIGALEDMIAQMADEFSDDDDEEEVK
tara:strand:- start:4204 stop:5892 length:1689 start_codon:yes stop_codon:yes gene_type:complete